MVDAKLDAVPLVDIDDEGRFKYILIKVWGRELADGSELSKLIVRGYGRAEWHGAYFIIFKDFFPNMSIHIADIYEEASGSIRGLGLDTECLGGGRIEHHPDLKKLKVFGYSTVFAQRYFSHQIDFFN